MTLIEELSRVTEGCYVNTTSHFHLVEDNGECGCTCTSSKGIVKLKFASKVLHKIHTEINVYFMQNF